MILAGIFTSNFSRRTEERGQQAKITCLLENGRDCVKIKSSFREIRVIIPSH